jgi:hypothetical protein
MITTITITPTIPTPPFLEFIIGPSASMAYEAHRPPLPDAQSTPLREHVRIGVLPCGRRRGFAG